MRIATASIIPSANSWYRSCAGAARAWLLLAAVGLAFGLITIVMPVLATATVATTMTLATMHVITGLVWFILVWRAAR